MFHGAKGNMQECSKGGQCSEKHQYIGLLEVLNNFKVCETVKEEECQDQLVKRYQVKLNSKVVPPLTNSYFPRSICVRTIFCPSYNVCKVLSGNNFLTLTTNMIIGTNARRFHARSALWCPRNSAELFPMRCFKPYKLKRVLNYSLY